MLITHRHNLTKAQAQAQMQKLATFWKNGHGVQVEEGLNQICVQGKLKGVSFSATMVATEQAVTVTGSDPGWLFRSAAKKYVKEKLCEYLGS
jgi:hypothetical protein